MVEAGQGQAVEVAVYLEGGQGAADGRHIEVDHLDVAGVVEALGLVLGDDDDAHALHHVQVVVEGAGRVGGGVGGQAGLQVVVEGPVAGAAAHGDAGEEDGAALAGGRADAAGGDLGGRGHDELEAALRRRGGVEEEDVLRAGAGVNG